MKKKIMFGGIGFVVIGVVAFLMSQSGVPAPNPDAMERMRGTEGYYAESEELTFVEPGGELVANLGDGPYVKVKFDAVYRIGKEWTPEGGEAAAAFTAKAAAIRSALIIMMGNKKSTDLKGASIVLLKEEIIRMLNDIVFAKKHARVEDIVFKELLVQR